MPQASPEQTPNFGPIPDGIKEVATREAERYHAFMVAHGEPDGELWEALELAFYAGFCKAFNYTKAVALLRAKPKP